jgi:hypothetical protein
MQALNGRTERLAIAVSGYAVGGQLVEPLSATGLSH